MQMTPPIEIGVGVRVGGAVKDRVGVLVGVRVRVAVGLDDAAGTGVAVGLEGRVEVGEEIGVAVSVGTHVPLAHALMSGALAIGPVATGITSTQASERLSRQSEITAKIAVTLVVPHQSFWALRARLPVGARYEMVKPPFCTRLFCVKLGT